MNKLYNYFKKLYEEERIGHAFLIGNTTFDSCKDELEKVFSKFIFNAKIKIKDNPSIYLIEPEGNIITKSQIKELIQNISTTSQVYGKKIYIICGCEKLSPNVYNSLLKTIEEPEEGVIAFLITSNIDLVASTIKSRCQVIFIKSELDKIEDEETYELALDIVKKIEKNNLKFFAENKNIYSIITDRNVYKKVVKEIFNIYKRILYSKVNYVFDEELNKICINDKVDTICKKILSINSIIEKEDININKDMLIDKLIISIWRCNNENSINRVQT